MNFKWARVVYPLPSTTSHLLVQIEEFSSGFLSPPTPHTELPSAYRNRSALLMPGYTIPCRASELGILIIDHKTLYYSPSKNTLMTRVSNFTGRRLPPIGACPSRLDVNLDFEFKVIHSLHSYK